MSDCKFCPIEKECHYPFKPCDCVHQRKYWDINRRAEYNRKEDEDAYKGILERITGSIS